MKAKILLPLIAIIFLSSCANKFSLTKRKYTKGYYFASSKNNSSSKKEIEHKSVAIKNLPTKHSGLAVEPVSDPEIITTSNNEPIIVTKTSPKINAHKNKTSNLTASSDSKNNFAPKSDIKPILEKKDLQGNSEKKGSSNGTLVLEIILCFFPFINLIAIYLHDGKSITLNFWITLLLDFTLIGGIIFSLLVVLDVVDLS